MNDLFQYTIVAIIIFAIIVIIFTIIHQKLKKYFTDTGYETGMGW